MQRMCRQCGKWYEDPGLGSRVAPQGLCSQACAKLRAKDRANERASRRRVPPRSPRRVFAATGRDWSGAREKVDAEGCCRACGRRPGAGWVLDAAHLVRRSQGGTDDPDGVVPLCRHEFGAEKGCHERFDAGTMDLVGSLERGEEMHVVGLVGLEGAYRVLAAVQWRRVNGRAS